MKLLLYLNIILLAGCASKPERPSPALPPPEDRSLPDLTPFLSAVAKANHVAVYEGLPHQAWDRELYAVEVKRTDIVWFEGYPFYATPLAVPEYELKSITEIALDRGGHLPFGGYKLCGGYHPDYAVIWSNAGERSGSLICFGCHEWKNFTPAGRLYEDLGTASYDKLRRILSKYVIQRPKRKDG
jgi:hypothetical protein